MTRKGGPCQHEQGWGTQHVGVGRCKLHGGAEPHAQVNGMVELARREWAVMGMPLSLEPQDAILECIQIAAGEVAYASGQIAAIDQADAVGAVLSRTIRRPVPAKAESDGGESEAQEVEELRYGPPALHIWIVTRHRAMDRLVAYSAVALRAGIEERRVKIAEEQGALLAQAIRGILRELGVMDRPEAPAVVRKHLSLLSGGA